MDFTRKNKRWVLALAALGFTSYGAFKVYHSSSVARKREKISKLFGSLVSLAEAVSDSAETVSLVSKDLKTFLQSESDQIPNTLKQISKIAKSDEFSESLINVTEAITVGISHSSQSRIYNSKIADSGFVDRVMDKLFTKAGSGFASIVVGSFARNLVMALCSSEILSSSDSNSNSFDHRWIDVIYSDDCRKLIGDWIQVFVSTAVSVYLDKTMHINTYDELFSGLTNPKYDPKVKDLLVSICNVGVETLVRTYSHVAQNTNIDSPYIEDKRRNGDSGWVSNISSTLAIPSNRRLVLDVTGEVTSETVKSLLEIVTKKVENRVKNCAEVVHDSVAEKGFGVARYITAKSSAAATICISLCLQIIEAPWIFAPAV